MSGQQLDFQLAMRPDIETQVTITSDAGMSSRR